MLLIKNTPLCAALFVGTLASASSAQVIFTPGTTVATGQQAGDPALADLDGDGILDLAVPTDGLGNQELVELYRGLGDGTFAPNGFVLLPNNSSPQAAAAADFDGDGDLDLVVTLDNLGQVAMLRNDGPFVFGLSSLTSTGGVESRTMALADLDGDGDVDVAVGNRDSHNVSVLLNGGGALALAGVFPAGLEPRDIAAGDLNGDGIPEIVTAAHDSRQVVVLNGLGGGAFGAGQFLAVPAGTRPDGIAMGDIDGDGDLDVVAGTGDDNAATQNFLSVYSNVGGVLAGPIPYATGGLDAGDVLLADLDGDGDVDAAVLNQTSGTIATLVNAGGVFGAPQSIAFGGEPSTIVGGDVDGNGGVDLAVTRRQAAGVSLFINGHGGGNGGTGVNFCAAVLNSTGAPASIAAAGSGSVVANDLTLECTNMPMGAFGYFIVSRNAGFVAGPGGATGNLCLGGTIGRYDMSVMSTGGLGRITMAVDLAALPMPTGPIAVLSGETWRFQCWFRDIVLSQPTSNFSDGVAVTFN